MSGWGSGPWGSSRWGSSTGGPTPPSPTGEARPAGLGAEALGDPLGSGGPIHVVRARAIEGQTIRLVLDEEPLHVSPGGTFDALNPANYRITILVGTGTDPQAVGVKAHVVEGPAAGPVAAGQWGVDVQTDRQLVVGMTYQIMVNPAVQAASGGSMGWPYAAPFVGSVRLSAAAPPPRQLTNIDLGMNIATGAYLTDDSGDVAPQGGIDGLKKRVFRRLGTAKNAWAHLPGYGLLMQLKSPASIRQILELKADAVRQISQEPEIAAVDVKTSFAASVLTMAVKARTKTGLVLDATLTQDTDSGAIVLT